MISNRFASIDIGTNTIILLIGEVDNAGNINYLCDKTVLARLGEKTEGKNIIIPAAAGRAKAVLKDFKKICACYKTESIFAAGTSALRDAENRDSIKKEFEEILGCGIQIISGSQEAAYSFSGTVIDESQSVVIDIGGGSTEIIAGRNMQPDFRESLQIGAVRITEKFFTRHPPHKSQIKKAEDFIKKHFKTLPREKIKGKFYSVSGTPTTIVTVLLGLSDFEEEKVNGFMLKKKDLDKVTEIFQTSDIQTIIDKYHVQPLRADIILAGCIILKEFTDFFNFSETIVSSGGLRYGILHELIKFEYK